MRAKLLYWIPRIIAILSILFMLLFSLDAFSGNETVVRKLLGFFMNSIPVLIITGILIIAWKWELAGGILFVLSFFVAAVFFRSFSRNPASLIVITPFLITGILFLLHYFLYGRSRGKE
jgi:hypothetical protein